MTSPAAPRRPTTRAPSTAATSADAPTAGVPGTRAGRVRTDVVLRTTPIVVRALSEPMTALLRDGDGLDGYSSRSEAVMATAVAAVMAGWSESTWRTALEGGCEELASWASAQHRHGAHRRFRSAADADRRLATTWRNAEQFVREHPPTGDYFTLQAELAESVQLVESVGWGGQGGPSEHAVLRVLLDIAAGACTLTPSASSRQISELAGISDTAVTNTLARLVRKGWLRQVCPAQGVHAPTWRVLRPSPEELPAPAPSVAAVLEDLPTWPLEAAAHPRASVRAHDAFSHTIHGGLGRIAARLVDLLEPTGTVALSIEQLAARSGHHPKTVRRYVRALAAAGLVEVDHRGVRCLLPHDDEDATSALLDDVAGALGCTGVVARRRARHAAQREAFVSWRTEFEARRGWRVERGLHRPEQPQLPMTGPPLPQGRVPQPRAA